MYRPPAEKTVRVATSNVPIPHWLGNLITYFAHSIQSRFVQKNRNVESLFILPNGKPLGIIFSSLLK